MRKDASNLLYLLKISLAVSNTPAMCLFVCLLMLVASRPHQRMPPTFIQTVICSATVKKWVKQVCWWVTITYKDSSTCPRHLMHKYCNWIWNICFLVGNLLQKILLLIYISTSRSDLGRYILRLWDSQDFVVSLAIEYFLKWSHNVILLIALIKKWVGWYWNAHAVMDLLRTQTAISSPSFFASIRG